MEKWLSNPVTTALTVKSGVWRHGFSTSKWPKVKWIESQAYLHSVVGVKARNRTIFTVSNSTVASPDKRLKGVSHRNVELSKCEFCGKLGPKFKKFKRSKRFCSNSCAKRFNLNGNKRADHDDTGGPGRKKKSGFRGRKGSYIKEQEVELEEEGEELEEGSVDTPMGEEEEVVALPPQVKQEKMVEEEPHRTATKWTVQDVFDFIRGLGAWCCDYADTFRAQEIDGQALLLLNYDHLVKSMGMTLGPALKLVKHIDALKEEMAEQQA